MQRVFVLDKNKKPLMPCPAARARQLLKKGRAAVYCFKPFIIILIHYSEGKTQSIELKFDPGSKVTGIALAVKNKVIWAANLHHRGNAIKNALESRRALRRGRRSRTTRYRKPRFDNRTRSKGWLPPSLHSRVDNIYHWTKKLINCASISSIAIETARFDTQKMENPEVSGVEYQQGTLFGYEVREYLLEKWGRKCAYCHAEKIRLEIDHIIPKSRGGSSRVSNLLITCRACNEKKGNHFIKDFLQKKPLTLQKILKYKKVSLKDTASINATRYAIGDSLQSFSLPLSFWSGGRTKFNRSSRGYPKDHWIDAACVGISGKEIEISPLLVPLTIIATGRGSRQMRRVGRFGFPKASAKGQKNIRGFQTGDLVLARVPNGKKAGKYQGRVAVRSTGFFNIKTETDTIQGISWRFCKKLHCSDGYNYNPQKKEQRFLLALKDEVSPLSNG